MMNKIGKLLNYPETWCSFVIRLFALVLVITAFIVTAIPPLLCYVAEGATIDFYFISFLVSFFYYGCHVIAKDSFDWYKSFLDKLPSCPKINWNKGE